ncbi:MMPL family transporter [Demequina soli]|uniref:MMPL family transporter n=1 Tax=Demequina soli TaxID=1638987 RepID=UPI0007808FE8|nr:MMPL family transporter [Demequina soli]
MSRLARWCAVNRYTVIALWVAMIAGLGIATTAIGSNFISPTDAPSTESTKAYALLGELGASSTSSPQASGQVVWHAESGTVDDADVVDTVNALLADLAAIDGVASVASPYSDEGAAQISADRETAFASITFTDDADRKAVSSEVTEAVDAVDAGTVVDAAAWGSGFKAEFTAPPVELIGIIAALAILMLVFRSALAGILPIVTGVAGVGASILVVTVGSNVIDIPSTATQMGSLIGLGVGIDYALFIVNRFRKALKKGATVLQAVEESVNTSGRAVVFAGATVVIALVGLLLLQIGVLSGMALAAALTVAFTVASAITLLPALLAVLGPRVLGRRGRRAYLNSGAAGFHDEASPFFSRWAKTVANRPVAVAAAATLIMTILAAPALGIRLGSTDATSEPVDSPAYRHHELMGTGFGDGFDSPLLVVAATPDDSTKDAFADLVTAIEGADGVQVAYTAGTDADVSLVTTMPTTSAASAQTADLVNRLRDDLIPAAEDGTSLEVFVGGTTAMNVDFATLLTEKLPVYLLVIAALGFVVLAVAFRSIAVPLVGALSNLLTMAVSLGAVTAAFGWGWVSSLLGIGTGGPIEPSVPIIVVGIVFGLSMDYQVFLMSRVHEEWTRTRDNRRALSVGIAETGPVIVAAAAIMFSVFSAFGLMPLRIIAEMGVGLALAILADAVVVRLGLMPAVLHLLGNRSWWYPRWADRITPRVSIEGDAGDAAITSVGEKRFAAAGS